MNQLKLGVKRVFSILSITFGRMVAGVVMISCVVLHDWTFFWFDGNGADGSSANISKETNQRSKGMTESWAEPCRLILKESPISPHLGLSLRVTSWVKIRNNRPWKKTVAFLGIRRRLQNDQGWPNNLHGLPGNMMFCGGCPSSLLVHSAVEANRTTALSSSRGTQPPWPVGTSRENGDGTNNCWVPWYYFIFNHTQLSYYKDGFVKILSKVDRIHSFVSFSSVCRPVNSIFEWSNFWMAWMVPMMTFCFMSNASGNLKKWSKNRGYSYLKIALWVERMMLNRGVWATNECVRHARVVQLLRWRFGLPLTKSVENHESG